MESTLIGGYNIRDFLCYVLTVLNLHTKQLTQEGVYTDYNDALEASYDIENWYYDRGYVTIQNEVLNKNASGYDEYILMEHVTSGQRIWISFKSSELHFNM